MTAPHHDAPRCPCGGPIVVSDASIPHPADEGIRVALLHCAMCGQHRPIDPTNPADLRILVHTWWSVGAWAGIDHQSKP